MKKLLAGITSLLLLFLFALPALAVKPTENLAQAQKVDWNLSAAVMPVPPYGSMDIPGSETASKLIVNQPNGNMEVMITGAMSGLHPNTTYTVYLSKEYTPYTPLSVVGTYKWLVLGTYEHDLTISTQNTDGTFSGVGGYPAGASLYATTETITGQVTGNTITFTTTYAGPYNPGYVATPKGTIQLDGSISGTLPWEWHTTAGYVKLASGSNGWPGLFTSTIQPFTFTTDEFGVGSWHLNLTDANFSTSGIYKLSVWINEAGRTILISNNFQVTVE